VVGWRSVGSPAGPGIAVMHLVPGTGWWIATFWDEAGSRWRACVDICTPLRLPGGVWSSADLEAGVQLARDGAGLFAQVGAGRLSAALTPGLAPIRQVPGRSAPAARSR
jgi:hypothetical protein